MPRAQGCAGAASFKLARCHGCAARLSQFCTAYQWMCGAIVSILHCLPMDVRRDCVSFARVQNSRRVRNLLPTLLL